MGVKSRSIEWELNQEKEKAAKKQAKKNKHVNV
jgi:hypothetical protein